MAINDWQGAHAVFERFDQTVSLDAAAVSFASRSCPAILESSLRTRRYDQFSIFACDPIEICELAPSETQCPFAALAARLEAYPRLDYQAAKRLPFCGGWIGFFSYEAGLALEGIDATTRRDDPWPGIRFALYDAIAIHDHSQRQWYVAGLDWPPGSVNRPPIEKRLRDVRERLLAAGTVRIRAVADIASTTPPTTNMSYETYLGKVCSAKEYISAGDIYQVNLTRRFTTTIDLSPIDLYRRLRKVSPSPRAAFLSWDDRAILSSSPELFLDLRLDHVVTRPIKGTLPRGGDPHTDAIRRRELSDSEKDRAELNMIIDLLRNDLGRACAYGSVRVRSAGEIEAHGEVLHRVATIEGDLRPECDWVDLLRATFPGGSITGAPKIRAMQLINELEPTARGVYCGSIGWIGLDGSLSLNIAIRTMVQRGNLVHLFAGGAIVADSDPESEFQEIIAKATGMFRAIGRPAPAKAPSDHEMVLP